MNQERGLFMRTTGLTIWVSVLTTILLLVGLPGYRSARAGSIDDAAFSLRMTAATTSVDRWADVSGMGGASAGGKWPSAINPAGSGWSPGTGRKGVGTSPQYTGIFFGEGTKVHLLSLSGVFGPTNPDRGITNRPDESRTKPLELTQEDTWGTWQPGIMILNSNRATMSDGVDFEWNALYGELQWGMKLSETFGIGANINYLSSQMEFGLDSDAVSESEGETYGLRVGGLYQASESLYVGLALDYAINPSRTTNFDFMGLGIGPQKERDTLTQFLVRPGVSFLATEDLTINFDYQYGHFSDDTGSLDVHRFYAGFDLTIVDGLYLRGGGMVNTEGDASPAVGLGFAPSESIYIDLAWQMNHFPEVKEEFGDSDLISIGVTILF
jgi:opacity protein-like surface antigen